MTVLKSQSCERFCNPHSSHASSILEIILEKGYAPRLLTRITSGQMSSIAAAALALVAGIYFHTFFIAYVTSVFIRLAFVIAAARVVRRRKTKFSRQSAAAAASTSQIWRISPRLTNIILGTTGRFLSVKTSLFYNQNRTATTDSSSDGQQSGAQKTEPKCCVTQLKFECFRIMSTHVIPFSTTRSSFSASRSALLELALRDVVFKINVTIQICDDEDEPKSTSFLRLFNRTEKRNCVTVSCAGELRIGVLQVFLFHPSILSSMVNRVTGFITGNKKGLQRLKSPFSVLSNLLPALDVHGLTFKIHADVEYPTDWTNAEGATVDCILKLDTLSLRMPDPIEGSNDPRVMLGLPHQLAANAKEEPSNIVSGIKDLHIGINTKLKHSGMDSNTGSDVFIPSLLLNMHMQPKRDLTSYLASIELCGDPMDEQTSLSMTRKEDAAFVSVSTGSCQIMSCFVILRRTWKPLLAELEAMRPIVLSEFPTDLIAVGGKNKIKKRAISLVLFSSTLGVRIGLDDDRKSPLRLTLASGINFNWYRKETGVIRPQSSYTGKLMKVIIKDLRLGHQRLEGEIFHVFKIDESCIDLGPLESDRQRSPTDQSTSYGESSPRILTATIGSMLFHVHDPRLIEEFFRFVGSFYSALAYTRPPLKSSSTSRHKRMVKGNIENVTINLKLLDIHLSTAVNYDERPTQETILFTVHGTDGLLSIAPSKTHVTFLSEVVKAKNTWINFSYFDSSLEFAPHKSLPQFLDPRQPYPKASDHRIKFYVSGSGLKIFIAPHETASSGIPSNKEGSRIDIMINALVFKEYALHSDGIIETSILKSSGLSSLALRLSEVVQSSMTHVESRLVSVLDVFIDFYGAALNVTWSPVFQWLLISAIEKVESTLSRFKPSQLTKEHVKERKRKFTNVNIRTNETGVYARLILSGGSMIDICTSSMVLTVGKDKDACWNKSNISMNAAETRLYVNEDSCEVLSVSSVHYSDILRRATVEEIATYTGKGRNDVDLIEDVVRGDDNLPVMENICIRLGTFAELKLSPSLHLGMVIEDLSSFMKIMDEGLRISRLEKKIQGEKKYQLMKIDVSLKCIDAIFFEETASHLGCNSVSALHNLEQDMSDIFVPDLNMNYRTNGLLERLRIHIKSFDCTIDRTTPRKITQEHLNELDEDKSYTHLYGPVVQGGDFDLSMNQLHCILHPLHMATPLISFNNFRAIGLLYLAGLDPRSPQVRPKREILLPVRCHHGKSATGPRNHSCPCSYGIQLYSTGIPIKFFHDMSISCGDLNFTYGKVMTSAIPELLLITRRLTPAPCVPQYPPSEPTLSLSWWDNLRYQFHGRVRLTAEIFSFLWLFDSEFDDHRSLLVTSSSFVLQHTCGRLKLATDNLQFLLPAISYHIFRFQESRHSDGNLSGQLLQSTAISERHTLILVPRFALDISFMWELTNPYATSSTAHHSPYSMTSDPINFRSKEIFDRFRSHGIHFVLKADLKPTIQRTGCWLALRADVLPWLAHKRKARTDSIHDKLDDGDGDSKKALPDILSVETNVNIDSLQLATWFDESGDSDFDSFASSDIIHVSVPTFQLHFENNSKSISLFGPIRAAKLNIENSPFELILRENNSSDDNANYAIYSSLCKDDFDWNNNFTRAERKHSDGITIIDILQAHADRIKSFDYLLIVDQLDICNQSLDEIRHQALERSGQGAPQTLDRTVTIEEVKKQKAPWTVLVSGLKLLWTLEIRYSVVSVVQDLLFAINYVNVNRRGTAQILDSTEKPVDPAMLKSPQSTSPYDQVYTSPISKYSHDAEESTIGPPVSHLDYLLSTPISDPEGLNPTGYPANGRPSLNFTKTLFSSPLMKREVMVDLDESVPRFDIYLSNPQIQLHSESTGGGVILAMRAAYVEGRRFVHLFTKTSEASDTTADSLLHRTDNLYTLDMMEIYSIKPSHSTLEWLKVGNTSIVENKVISTFTPELSKDIPTFTPELSLHEPRSFEVTDLFTKIMEHSTFKTLQICYNPPVEFTKEELEEMIQSNSIEELLVPDTGDDQEHGTFEYIDIAIDKLSFMLDSYQFSTTLDVIRNVLLEPPKQPRPRFYRSLINQIKEEESELLDTSIVHNIATGSRLKSSSMAMDEMLKNLHGNSNKSTPHQLSKKDRDLLQAKAHTLLEDLDDAQKMSVELSLRRIKWSLSKVKWRVDSPSYDDRLTIDFTGLSGYHDFPRSGGIHSQLSLEDLNISSEKPSPEAANFSYSSAVIRTIVGVERSPCERCGKPFYRSNNESNSCIFHPGIYSSSAAGEYRWTCCSAALPDALGCAARPHTGKERALALRLDAFPRVVKGLTVYRHAEGNIFPGVPHTLVLQLTKSLSKLLGEYFFGDGNGINGAMNSSEISSDLSSEISDGDGFDNNDGSEKNHQTQSNQGGRRKTNASSSKASSSKVSTETPRSEPNIELYFVKYWRLGELNMNISIAGFGKYRNITDFGLSVSSFQAAYNIGSAQYLIKQLKLHILRSLASNGLEKIRDKISGKVRRRMLDYDEEEDDEKDNKEDHVALLLGIHKR